MGMVYPINCNNESARQPTGRQRQEWLDASPDWQTAPPTEPGWYWAFQRDAVIPQVVELVGAEVIRIGTDETFSAADFTHWLGPLDVWDPLQA